MCTITPLFCGIGVQKVVFDYYRLSPVSTKLLSGFWTASQLTGRDKVTSLAALTLVFAAGMKPMIFFFYFLFFSRRFRGQYIHRRVKPKQPSPVWLSVISLSSSQHVKYCSTSCWIVRVLSGYEENNHLLTGLCSQGKAGCTDNRFGWIVLYDGSTAISWIIRGCGIFLHISFRTLVLYLCRLTVAGRKSL